MPEPRRPNVLFVLSDDHAAHAISAYTDAGLGPELLRTPHLDRLAEEGRDHGRGQPFFCCVHHKAPHRSWEPGPEEADLFQGVDLPEPRTLWDDHAGRPAAAAARMRIDQDLYPGDVKGHPPAGLTQRERKLWFYDRYIKDYLRCCAGVDKSVGQLLGWLDDAGEAENTIVVYTSDQGFFLGDHGWYDKRFIYEHSLRMPMLLRFPGRVPPSAPADLITNVDFAPTLLDLCGLPPEPAMQGSSFAPIARGDGTPEGWQRSVYHRHWTDSDRTHSTTAHYGVRTHSHKLTCFYADPLDAAGSGQVNTNVEPYWELFDLQADPDELRNAYGEPGTEALTRELKRELRGLQERFADEPVAEPA